MQPEIIVTGLKVADFPDDQLSIRGIFEHNHNWDRYALEHAGDLRPVERQEVEKMLSCHGPGQGFLHYECHACGKTVVKSLGCNSRLCSRCGKPHADRWAASLKRTILPLPHRHLTFTLPEQLREVIRRHRAPLMKAMMDATIRTLDEALGKVLRAKARSRAGAIAVLHPFGRDLEFKPHVHVLCLEGAFVGERFVHMTFFPMELFRKTWQYHVLTAFRRVLRAEEPAAVPLIDQLFRKFPDGFYVHVTKETRVSDPDKVLRYVGRYVRHPAMAESRLVGYDGEWVTIRWTAHDGGGERHRTMPVGEFIGALVQHVPERHFKMVRHYGVYARHRKGRYRHGAERWTMAQAKLERFDGEGHRAPVVSCPECGYEMVCYGYTPPVPRDAAMLGSKVTDWTELLPSVA